MRIIYHHDISSKSPNGILTYLRTYIEYSRINNLEYWSPVTNSRQYSFGNRNIPLYELKSVNTPKFFPQSFRNIISISKSFSNSINCDIPLMLNVNEHVVAAPTKHSKSNIIFISHGSNHPSTMKFVGLRRYLWNRFMDQIAITKATYVIVVSFQAKTVFQNRFPRYENRVKYLPTFVNDDIFHSSKDISTRKKTRKKFGITENDFVIVYAGRLAVEKQVSLAMQSFSILQKSIPHSKFLIIGTGPEQVKLSMLQKELRLNDKVIFLGDQNNNQTINFINASDVSILLSAYEGTSLFMLESLVCGNPIIALDVADHRSILEDSGGGYVVPPKANPKEIAAKIQLLRTNLHQFSQQALTTANTYKASIIVPKLDQLIEDKKYL